MKDFNNGYGLNYIRSVHKGNFDSTALHLFRHQYRNNGIYRQFADALGINPQKVQTPESIPFLPVSFFKSHKVLSAPETTDMKVFESSSTNSDIPGRHYVTDLALYQQSALQAFTTAYGNPADYVFFALLPSYLERGNSSLVYMARMLTDMGLPGSGFYLDEFEQLATNLQAAEQAGHKAILLGVTFALLDFAQSYPTKLRNTIVMETGGMKGRRPEMTRPEVHDILSTCFETKAIHSEYGMTELLSQAYAKTDGVFRPADTMKVLVRDVNDPLDVGATGSGCLNIIDLANVNSCAFIATDDIGKVHADGSFEVVGRVDHSALRGCNLMVL